MDNEILTRAYILGLDQLSYEINRPSQRLRRYKFTNSQLYKVGEIKTMASRNLSISRCAECLTEWIQLICVFTIDTVYLAIQFILGRCSIFNKNGPSVPNNKASKRHNTVGVELTIVWWLTGIHMKWITGQVDIHSQIAENECDWASSIIFQRPLSKSNHSDAQAICLS